MVAIPHDLDRRRLTDCELTDRHDEFVGVGVIFRSDESARLPKKPSNLVSSHRRYSVPPLVDHCLADLAKAADD